MKIKYTVKMWREENQFVAQAIPLDFMSSGHTPESARRALYESVYLFLVTAAEEGILEEILEEIGYELQQ